MSQSEQIKDLVAALAKAQAVMKPAIYNKINPHFKSRYADFSSCMDACRLPLAENGLAIIQSCETIDGKLNLVSMLAHISGQWMKSEFPIITTKMDSQGIGSAMTYAKRYSLCGLIGIVADEEGDDDGEAAVGRPKQEVNLLPSLLQMFDPSDKELVKEYISEVKKLFNWTEQETIKKFLDEKEILIKFNTWKTKRN